MTVRQQPNDDHERRDDTGLCVALWARAESQFYPLIMYSPEVFERGITVVRAVADKLRTETTVDGLVRAFTEPGSLALSAARETKTNIGDLDAYVLASAGFRLRQQEIAAGTKPAGRDGPMAGADDEW